MKNVGLMAIIFQLVCGLICCGIGIYDVIISADVAQIVIFFVVGALCLINAARMFIVDRKNKKDDE